VTDLNARKRHLTRQWQVTVEQWIETPSSAIAFGQRAGKPVVLKVVKAPSDEWNAGAVLAAFGGHGVVRVLEHRPGAMLMERALPGNSLADVVRAGNDEEATTILAAVMAAMLPDDPPPHCPTALLWGRAFANYRESGDTQLPPALFNSAEETYFDLCMTQRTTRLLHGDLQHYNVVFDDARGWLTIDPKGVVAEREFELAALLRNPHGVPGLYTASANIGRRLTYLCTRLELDYHRALRWAFAQSVLSAIWDVEDEGSTKPDGPALTLARTIQRMLG
jgi:streptomycin 6-kinase